LEELELCEDDPLKVAACFVKNNEGFSIYAGYCTNYPRYDKDCRIIDSSTFNFSSKLILINYTQIEKT